jgi:hypothetical protein
MAAYLPLWEAALGHRDLSHHQIRSRHGMRKLILLSVAIATVFTANQSEAQMGGRLSVEPYVGYNFFGDLPESDNRLEADLAYGGRVAYQMAPQWALFGNFQRSTPELITGVAEVSQGDRDVDHWSAGVEFSYVPRGGAERMLPVLLEAGVGQARYESETSDLAVNLGLASAIQFSPQIAIRYGVNDYISNYNGGDGIVNHVTARVGAQISF